MVMAFTSEEILESFVEEIVSKQPEPEQLAFEFSFVLLDVGRRAESAKRRYAARKATNDPRYARRLNRQRAWYHAQPAVVARAERRVLRNHLMQRAAARKADR
jgi:hypothetical protein